MKKPIISKFAGINEKGELCILALPHLTLKGVYKTNAGTLALYTC